MDIDKAMGILHGLAIGDALGAPTEFLNLPQIRSRYGADGITNLPARARFTDDTQMSIAIAEALVKAGEGEIESIMTAVREEFIKWYHSPENNRAPGRTCLRGVARMEEGVEWRKSGDPHSKGCGSAMRAAPIGYLYQHHPWKLKEVAHASGICTHGHPTADVASIGAAYLVKLALDGVTPERMIPELLAFTDGISNEWDDAILKVGRCLAREDEEKALVSLGEGWVGEEAVALALYCFLRYSDSYRKTVIRGANTNGDSDSIASIAGSISGAYLGVEAIPKSWIGKIEKSAYLADLAKRLAEKKSNLTQRPRSRKERQTA
jgi:ADP-ribosylglycohydrolase